jgi:hypothetical protein
MLMLNFLLKNVHHGLMVSMIALLITAFNHSFWVVFKAPEGGVDTSCSFSLLLCVSCLWLMIKPKYILSTNFWCVRSISLFLDLHLGSCFSLPFLALSSLFPTLLPNVLRFIRCSIMCVVWRFLLVALGLFFFVIKAPSLDAWCKLIRSVYILCFVIMWQVLNMKMLTSVVIFMSLVAYVHAADDASSGFSVPKFNATRIKYPGWLTEFHGWIAMKFPDLVELIQEEWEEPEELDEHSSEEDRANYKSYWNAQKRLYGALITAIPAGLRQALSTNARFNGTQALQLLQSRFGVVDAHDRSSALQRVNKSYVTPGSGIALKDATRQKDKMVEAHTEFTDAGGAALDDELLINYFLRAFPATYNQIKMAIRTQEFEGFEDLTEAFLRQVKQAEDDHNDNMNQPALHADQQQQQQQQQQQHGAFGGRGRGGRGRGANGRGRGLVPDFVTCLRCGVLGHLRTACQQAVARCVHCAADHLSVLCPNGPGGAQRDALTQGARNVAAEDVRRAQNRNQNAQNQNAHAAQAQPQNVQAQIAALMQQMQQLQQQAGALAQPAPVVAPAAPAPPAQQGNVAAPAIDPVHMAQVFQQMYPNFGQAAHNTGLFALQSAPLSVVSLPRAVDVFARQLALWASLLLASLYSALSPFLQVCLRARGGAGDEAEQGYCFFADDDDSMPILEENIDERCHCCELALQECLCHWLIENVDQTSGSLSDILEFDDIPTLDFPLEDSVIADAYECPRLDYYAAATSLFTLKRTFAHVLKQLVHHVRTSCWPVERTHLGFEDILELDVKSDWDVESKYLWDVDQLVALEAIWRTRVLEAIHASSMATPRQLICLTTSRYIKGTSYYNHARSIDAPIVVDVTPATLALGTSYTDVTDVQKITQSRILPLQSDSQCFFGRRDGTF